MSAPRCTVCNDTGEVGQLGSLDCRSCNAAETRMRLNAHMVFALHMPVADRDWAVFQYAQSLAEGVVRDYVEPKPVAWWRYSYIDQDGSHDLDMYYGDDPSKHYAVSIHPWNALYAAPVAAQPSEVTQDGLPWAIAEFWSSANPGRKVRMLAEGDAEIKAWGKRGDFIRWVYPAAPVAAVSAAPSGEVPAVDGLLKIMEVIRVFGDFYSQTQAGQALKEYRAAITATKE